MPKEESDAKLLHFPHCTAYNKGVSWPRGRACSGFAACSLNTRCRGLLHPSRMRILPNRAPFLSGCRRVTKTFDTVRQRRDDCQGCLDLMNRPLTPSLLCIARG
jgi:hypothetical protein